MLKIEYFRAKEGEQVTEAEFSSRDGKQSALLSIKQVGNMIKAYALKMLGLLVAFALGYLYRGSEG